VGSNWTAAIPAPSRAASPASASARARCGADSPRRGQSALHRANRPTATALYQVVWACPARSCRANASASPPASRQRPLAMTRHASQKIHGIQAAASAVGNDPARPIR